MEKDRQISLFESKERFVWGGGSEVLVVQEPEVRTITTHHNDMHTVAITDGISSSLLSTDYKDPPTVTVIGEDGKPQGLCRRLTPTECTRLQAFPEDWLNIGEWYDSKGKKHREADQPKYKAIGNSLALPFWQWMANRMVKQFDHKPTVGSLFDGISGFPLVYARAGAETRWTSEIEDFCIAVCKKHFGDEETGEKGDYERYLYTDFLWRPEAEEELAEDGKNRQGGEEEADTDTE